MLERYTNRVQNHFHYDKEYFNTNHNALYWVFGGRTEP